MTTLKTQGIVKNFNKLAVVNRVDMALNGGEIVGLLGPNGAGKTTCFDLICGLLRPDEGSIVLNDQNVTHLPMHQRARLGLQLRLHHTNHQLNDNKDIPREKGGRKKQSDRERGGRERKRESVCGCGVVCESECYERTCNLGPMPDSNSWTSFSVRAYSSELRIG